VLSQGFAWRLVAVKVLRDSSVVGSSRVGPTHFGVRCLCASVSLRQCVCCVRMRACHLLKSVCGQCCRTVVEEE
jgi:hypothetical protein